MLCEFCYTLLHWLDNCVSVIIFKYKCVLKAKLLQTMFNCNTMEENITHFSRNIIFLRNRIQLSRKEVSEKIGVNYPPTPEAMGWVVHIPVASVQPTQPLKPHSQPTTKWAYIVS